MKLSRLPPQAISISRRLGWQAVASGRAVRWASGESVRWGSTRALRHPFLGCGGLGRLGSRTNEIPLGSKSSLFCLEPCGD